MAQLVGYGSQYSLLHHVPVHLRAAPSPRRHGTSMAGNSGRLKELTHRSTIYNLSHHAMDRARHCSRSGTGPIQQACGSSHSEQGGCKVCQGADLQDKVSRHQPPCLACNPSHYITIPLVVFTPKPSPPLAQVLSWTEDQGAAHIGSRSPQSPCYKSRKLYYRPHTAPPPHIASRPLLQACDTITMTVTESIVHRTSMPMFHVLHTLTMTTKESHPNQTSRCSLTWRPVAPRSLPQLPTECQR